MIRPTIAPLAALLTLAAACAPVEEERSDALPGSGSDLASGTRPAGEPDLFMVEGLISAGVECPVITTADGSVYALSGNTGEYGIGDHVRIEAEMADASFCMQGEGTLIIDSIEGA